MVFSFWSSFIATMILGPLQITSHDISANYTIQFTISMMSEISSFYAIGCLLLISCCLLMTHSMTFYVIPYLLLYVVETTYRYKHPQFSHSSPKLLILCHYPQAYTLWVSHRVLHSSYCLHTIRYSCLSILISTTFWPLHSTLMPLQTSWMPMWPLGPQSWHGELTSSTHLFLMPLGHPWTLCVLHCVAILHFGSSSSSGAS